MSQTRKIFRYLFLFLLPVFIFVAVLFIMPLDKQYAYHFLRNECNDKGAWIYDRIFINPHPVDMAFIGSSRTKASVMEAAAEDDFRKMGMNISVANLGYCRWGRNLDYTIAKDLLTHKKVRYLIVELHEEEERLSHIDFAYVADSKDVLNPVLFFNQEVFKDYYHALAIRFEIFKKNLLQIRPRFPINNDDHGYGYSMQQADTAYLSMILRNRRERKQYVDTKFEKWINIKYPLKYIEKIATMADAKGCKVFFLYLPGYSADQQPVHAFDYCMKFGPVFIIPDSIQNNRANWRDDAHFNDSGASKMMRWLTMQMAPHSKN
jgi:hypothetical protein